MSFLHTGPRVDGSHHRGDWILRLLDSFLEWKQDRFGRPHLFIGTVNF
jgi:hypothetical protein